MNEQQNNNATRKRRSGQKPTKTERAEIQRIFLEAFSTTANVKACCQKAGIDRGTLYKWLEHDTEFSLRYRQAEQDANDVIRAAILQRGIQGVQEPVVSAGKLVYSPDGAPLSVTKYSDSLLSLLARARLPEFKEKSPGAELPTTQQQLIDPDLLAYLTNDEIAMIEQIIGQARARKLEAEQKTTM